MSQSQQKNQSFQFEIDLIQQAELARAEAVGNLVGKLAGSLKPKSGLMTQLIEKTAQWFRKPQAI